MKSVINFLIILSLVFSNAVIAADKSCMYPTTGRDPFEMVHVERNGLMVGLFKCTHCEGLRRPAPTPGTDNRITCEGCGNPFDVQEATIPPVYETRDGQTWTEARFIPSPEEAALFAKAGPNWGCASCGNQNWSFSPKCTGCANPRQGNEDPNFNPFAESKLVAKRGKEGVAHKNEDGARASTPRREVRDNTSSFKSRERDASSRPPMSDRTKKIILTATLAAVMAIGLGWYFAYNYTHPEPLAGEVTDIVKEFYLFKDEATYLRYRNSVLDPKNLPEGVQVLLEKDISVQHYSGPVQTSNGYLVQVTYANVVVGGYHFTPALLPEEASSWKKGDPVVLELEGPSDYKIKKAHN